MDVLRYPIGEFKVVHDATEEQRKEWIRSIAEMPKNLRRAIEGLDFAQLNIPYRPGGWTVQ
jgi:hypothetical protein